MKHLIAFFLCILSYTAIAQDSEIGHAKIQKAHFVVWFGIDFTQANLVGREGFTNPDDIVDRFWDSWNDLILSESDKYNIAEALNKFAFKYDLTSVRERNETISADGLVNDKPHTISKDDVAAEVAKLSSDEFQDGVGLVYIVENFDKLANKAQVWAAFFDIETRELIRTKRYEGDPRGFGLRNYWAGAIHDVIGQMESDYKKWEKKNK